ncbi:MAG: hypothetical protein OXC07_03910, partial [Kistimonas sp.]|nr:hypothetical protein [Kistimonas sp.]
SAPFIRIQLSPRGPHLLGLTRDHSLCLWQLDTHNRILIRRLEIPWCPPLPPTILSDETAFRGDGKQLVVPWYPHNTMQLWNLGEDGKWRQGRTIETTTSTKDYCRSHPSHWDKCDRDHMLLSIKSSCDGLMLTRSTDKSTCLWHRIRGGRWHCLMQCRKPKNLYYMPPPCMFPLPLGRTVCTSAQDRRGQTHLWFHAINQYGQLYKLMMTPISGPMTHAAPDGLTLVCGHERCLQLQQLTGPADENHMPRQQEPP